MLRIAQAFDSRQWGVIASASVKAAVVTAALPLAACGAGGFSLEKVDVDRSIVTSSTPSSPAAPADQDSDQTTIGNAVSSADIKELGGQAVPWANAGTGSRGAITELVELKDGGLTCRRFSATRESFDGVALYKGELCLAGAGGWRMQEFKAL
ncbi:RT0821/Lpp0805 family surface protein [Mesorhizobium sp. VK25A]|uniref:RT0821/Lpp0805 family surface protein n=1 Tax=Mesorhizobium vachelliae TaxID=3072309 RepID=A0ABU5A453_9HYPH|nr:MULTISPECIES: RT0821/Lpp0805 family surface protein [unclassified Mesorhizobium]MDX8531028.1 RT0821/Lpp0805 family surface protein [Mesorhizobium sp. VK25D]MDX8543221.1 RT0821/Lpp0805 family surface protein [Mesorhizobium sp. VK25A]